MEERYSQQTQAYKCPACSSALRFMPAGNLHCDSCGNDYEVEAIKALYEFDDEGGFDWGDYKKDRAGAQERLNESVVYVCRSCGAAIETDRTTVATRCPYCDNEVVISDRLTNGLRPDGIIPFRYESKDLPNLIRERFKGKKLLPGNFINEHKMSQILGVYIPFWLFYVGLDGQMTLEGTQTRAWADSKYNYVETSHYLVQMDGSMRFGGVPVDASIKMDDDLMDSIEPYDFSQMVDFDPAYLVGYVADRFDADPDASLPRATARMNKSAEQVFAQAAPRHYDTVSIRSNQMRVVNPNLRYVLLPVYLLNLDYGGKKYRFAVNGQTGKIVGELPVSKGKAWAWRLGIAAVTAAAVTMILSFINL